MKTVARQFGRHHRRLLLAYVPTKATVQIAHSESLQTFPPARIGALEGFPATIGANGKDRV